MPKKTEAEIIRPFQLELDKVRTAWGLDKKKAAKELKELQEARDKDKEFFIAQGHEMKDAIQTMSPEKVKELEEQLSEARQLHGEVLTELEKEVADHQITEDQLTAANGTIATMNGAIATYKLEIEDLKKQIPEGNVPGRPRTRRSRRS